MHSTPTKVDVNAVGAQLHERPLNAALGSLVVEGIIITNALQEGHLQHTCTQIAR